MSADPTPRHSRRHFLRQSVGFGAALSFGGLADLASLAAQESDPWHGERLADLVFQGEPRDPLGTRIASGLNARRYTDLSKIDRDRLVTPTREFFLRTDVPDQLDRDRPWRITIDGLARRPARRSPDDLEPHVRPKGVHLIECAGNSRATRFGLMSTAEWSGVPLEQLLREVEPLPTAKAVRITGFDQHSQGSTNSEAGCSWIFTRHQLVSAGAFLATRMNGQALPLEHGFPARLVVPGWYGCCCIKWVQRVELVDGEQPATSQMREFAARTHQDGVPRRAADFRPATIDRAAMPVRVEKWRVDGKIRYRVVGIDWGGDRSVGKLRIRFHPQNPYQPVTTQPEGDSSRWAVWHHLWAPIVPGRYLIQLEIGDPPVLSRRLGAGLYLRGIAVDEV